MKKCGFVMMLLSALIMVTACKSDPSVPAKPAEENRFNQLNPVTEYFSRGISESVVDVVDDNLQLDALNRELNGCWVSGEMTLESVNFRMGMDARDGEVRFYVEQKLLGSQKEWYKCPVDYDSANNKPVYGSVKYKLGTDSSGNNVISVTLLDDGEHVCVGAKYSVDGNTLTLTGEDDVSIELTKSADDTFKGAADGAGGIVVSSGFSIGLGYELLAWTDVELAQEADNNLPRDKVFVSSKDNIAGYYIVKFTETEFKVYRIYEEGGAYKLYIETYPDYLTESYLTGKDKGSKDILYFSLKRQFGTRNEQGVYVVDADNDPWIGFNASVYYTLSSDNLSLKSMPYCDQENPYEMVLTSRDGSSFENLINGKTTGSVLDTEPVKTFLGIN